MPGVTPELGRRLAESGLEVPDDMRKAIVEAAERLAEAIERLKASLETRETAGPSS
jgi:hypothetical protein